MAKYTSRQFHYGLQDERRERIRLWNEKRGMKCGICGSVLSSMGGTTQMCRRCWGITLGKSRRRHV